MAENVFFTDLLHKMVFITFTSLILKFNNAGGLLSNVLLFSLIWSKE